MIFRRGKSLVSDSSPAQRQAAYAGNPAGCGALPKSTPRVWRKIQTTPLHDGQLARKISLESFPPWSPPQRRTVSSAQSRIRRHGPHRQTDNDRIGRRDCQRPAPHRPALLVLRRTLSRRHSPRGRRGGGGPSGSSRRWNVSFRPSGKLKITELSGFTV